VSIKMLRFYDNQEVGFRLPEIPPSTMHTRALADSIANTASSSAYRQCAISKLFVLLVLSRRSDRRPADNIRRPILLAWNNLR
jgi:hypothetical protein